MANFTYKCVTVPDVFNTGTKGKDSHSSAVSTYENKINEAATDGWELVTVDTVTSVQNPGCIAGLFGSKGEVVTLKILILKKPA